MLFSTFVTHRALKFYCYKVHYKAFTVHYIIVDINVMTLFSVVGPIVIITQQRADMLS